MSNFTDYVGGGSGIDYWVSGTTYAMGKVVRSPADHQLYVRIVAGAGTTDPSSDATNWRPDGARAIKGIQRGYTTVNANSISITISSVNTAKTELRWLGGQGTDSGATVSVIPKLALTNSTTITATIGVNGSIPVSWELTEYY